VKFRFWQEGKWLTFEGPNPAGSDAWDATLDLFAVVTGGVAPRRVAAICKPLRRYYYWQHGQPLKKACLS